MIFRCTAASERRCGPPVPPHLTLTEPVPGGALDGSRRLVEGAAGGLDRGQPAQPVGMFLLRQVQSQGVPARVVMELLGHSQITLTLGTYTHVVPELARDAAVRMGDALWG